MSDNQSEQDYMRSNLIAQQKLISEEMQARMNEGQHDSENKRYQSFFNKTRFPPINQNVGRKIGSIEYAPSGEAQFINTRQEALIKERQKKNESIYESSGGNSLFSQSEKVEDSLLKEALSVNSDKKEEGNQSDGVQFKSHLMLRTNERKKDEKAKKRKEKIFNVKQKKQGEYENKKQGEYENKKKLEKESEMKKFANSLPKSIDYLKLYNVFIVGHLVDPNILKNADLSKFDFQLHKRSFVDVSNLPIGEFFITNETDEEKGQPLQENDMEIEDEEIEQRPKVAKKFNKSHDKKNPTEKDKMDIEEEMFGESVELKPKEKSEASVDKVSEQDEIKCPSADEDEFDKNYKILEIDLRNEENTATMACSIDKNIYENRHCFVLLDKHKLNNLCKKINKNGNNKDILESNHERVDSMSSNESKQVGVDSVDSNGDIPTPMEDEQIYLWTNNDDDEKEEIALSSKQSVKSEIHLRNAFVNFLPIDCLADSMLKLQSQCKQIRYEDNEYVIKKKDQLEEMKKIVDKRIRDTLRILKDNCKKDKITKQSDRLNELKIKRDFNNFLAYDRLLDKLMTTVQIKAYNYVLESHKNALEDKVNYDKDNFEEIYKKYSSRKKYNKRSALKEKSNLDEDYLKDSECCICFKIFNEDDEKLKNPLVYCEKCNVSVHAKCYGIQGKLERNIKFVCDLCKRYHNLNQRENIKCALCLSPNGAMKMIDDENWAHVTCIFLSRKYYFKDYLMMNTVVKLESANGLLENSVSNNICVICRNKGGELTKCEKCNSWYHFFCAYFDGANIKFDYNERKNLNNQMLIDDLKPDDNNNYFAQRVPEEEELPFVNEARAYYRILHCGNCWEKKAYFHADKVEDEADLEDNEEKSRINTLKLIYFRKMVYQKLPNSG